MPKSIKVVFENLRKKYKLNNFYLASGGLSDVKGPGTSDVDIVYFVDDYNNLDHLFPKSQKDPRPDKNRCYYLFISEGRQVSICASNDKSVMRSITHRKNELMLNQFQMLTACAINYKLLGMKTEPAWATALEISGDPYEILARPTKDLKKIASVKEKKLQQIYKNL